VPRQVKGITQPRIFTPPLRKLTRQTTWGFAFIDFCRDVVGIPLLPWEEWLAKHALEVTGSTTGTWHFRFRYIVVLVARQNGKTIFSKLLALFFLYVLGVQLIIGTAQNLDFAEDVWESAVDTAEANPALATEVERVVRTNGKRELKLTGGRRYKVKAANRKTRGWSSDLVLLDETREQQTWDAWRAVTKTTMARPDALVWSMSNAGDESSVVLRSLRLKAHKALGDPDGIVAALGEYDSTSVGESVKDDSLGLFEWSAAPGLPITDEKGLRQANPSLGYGFMTLRALLAAASTDDEAGFRTEDLCQWVTSMVEPPFPAGAWEACTDQNSRIAEGSELYWGIDVSDDRRFCSIAVCGEREDRQLHVELVAYRVGWKWAAKWLATRTAAYGSMRIGLQARGAPISSHIQELEEIDGLEIVEIGGRDLGASAGRLYDAVAASTGDTDVDQIWHITQPALDAAAEIAQKRALGDGAWSWDRANSPSDISPLVAVTMAHALACGIGDTPLWPSAYAEDQTVAVVR
jgi:hypothetical protein